MTIFKKFLNKFHSQKGITGTDVAVSIIIITATIAVITGIYINVMNSSKENIRYSAATRIATQLSEKIEAISYEELENVTTLEIAADEEDVERKILDITIPLGYGVKITKIKLTSELDIMTKYNIVVSFRVNGEHNSTVEVQRIKERELLEQTNEPDLFLIKNYTSNTLIYPIKYTASGYMITTTSDDDWYNYDDGYYAIAYKATSRKNIGDLVAPGIGDMYVWVPRFAKKTDSQLTETNLAYLYGTSNHMIVLNNIDVSKMFYSYTLKFEEGAYQDATQYVTNTFSDNDGLSGMWYIDGGTNDSKVENAYNALTSIVPKAN